MGTSASSLNGRLDQNRHEAPADTKEGTERQREHGKVARDRAGNVINSGTAERWLGVTRQRSYFADKEQERRDGSEKRLRTATTTSTATKTTSTRAGGVQNFQGRVSPF